MTLGARCTCPECRTLDQLPERLQGIPDSWQMKLPIARPKRRPTHQRGKNDAA